MSGTVSQRGLARASPNRLRELHIRFLDEQGATLASRDQRLVQVGSGLSGLYSGAGRRSAARFHASKTVTQHPRGWPPNREAQPRGSGLTPLCHPLGCLSAIRSSPRGDAHLLR